MKLSRSIKQIVIAMTVGLVILAIGATPVQAATVKLTSARRTALNHFLTAFTTEHLGNFTRSKGPSDSMLVKFGVWHLYHYGTQADVSFDSDSHGFVDVAKVDAVDTRYFGRTVKARASYGTAEPGLVSYSNGLYRFMPGDGGEYPWSEVTKVSSSKGHIWNVQLNSVGHRDYESGPHQIKNVYEATLRVSGTKAHPVFKLVAWRLLKVRVPSVKAFFFTDAEDILKNNGFKVTSKGVYAGSGGATTDGTVYKQSPAAGKLMPKGTRVTIWWGYERS